MAEAGAAVDCPVINVIDITCYITDIDRSQVKLSSKERKRAKELEAQLINIQGSV